MKIYVLTKTDFADDFCTDTFVFKTMDEAKEAMSDDYKRESGSLSEDGCDMFIGDMSAEIRDIECGDFWLRWDISEHEI